MRLIATVFVVLALGGCDQDPFRATPKLTLSANPMSLQSWPTSPESAPGGTVTVSWESFATYACEASGAWSGLRPISGSATFTHLGPGLYNFELTCRGLKGAVSEAVEVEVWAYEPGVPRLSMTYAAPIVAVGESTILAWTTDIARSCVASGAWSGSKPPNGSESVVVPAAGYNSYTLTCQGSGGGQVTYTILVFGDQATVALAAAPQTVAPGGTTTLTWSSTRASSCTASGAWSGPRATSGSETVTLPSLGDYVFDLTCNDPGAAATGSVTAVASAPNVEFEAFPPAALVGETVTLHWRALYADACTASDGWSGSRPLTGSHTFTVQAPGSLAFGLTCINAEAQTARAVTVSATAAPALPPAVSFQLNARHDGFVNFAGGVQLPAQSSPAWSRDLGYPTQWPLIADGRVYLVSRPPAAFRLYALDQATGAIVWGPIERTDTVTRGYAYANGRVFVLSFDGELEAFDAADGDLLWSKDLPESWFVSAPTAYGGLVFATGEAGTFALDEATGETRWTNDMWGFNSAPAVTSQGVYTLKSCWMKGMNPVFGTDLWQRTAPCSGGGGATIAARDSHLYVRRLASFDDGLIVDEVTGSDVGDMASQVVPAVTDSQLFTVNARTLAAQDLATGSQTWTFTGDGQLSSAPIVVNDTVFIGSLSGAVFALDAATGTQVWAGSAPAGIEDIGAQELTAIMAGEGWLVVPAGNHVAAWRIVP